MCAYVNSSILRTLVLHVVQDDKAITWGGVMFMKGKPEFIINLLPGIVLKFNTLLLISQATRLHPKSLRCDDDLRCQRRIRKKR